MTKTHHSQVYNRNLWAVNKRNLWTHLQSWLVDIPLVLPGLTYREKEKIAIWLRSLLEENMWGYQSCSGTIYFGPKVVHDTTIFSVIAPSRVEGLVRSESIYSCQFQFFWKSPLSLLSMGCYQNRGVIILLFSSSIKSWIKWVVFSSESRKYFIQGLVQSILFCTLVFISKV